MGIGHPIEAPVLTSEEALVEKGIGIIQSWYVTPGNLAIAAVIKAARRGIARQDPEGFDYDDEDS